MPTTTATKLSPDNGRCIVTSTYPDMPRERQRYWIALHAEGLADLCDGARTERIPWLRHGALIIDSHAALLADVKELAPDTHPN